jgi:hypothetical protein
LLYPVSLQMMPVLISPPGFVVPQLTVEIELSDPEESTCG